MLQRSDGAGSRRGDVAPLAGSPPPRRPLSFEARPPCLGPRPRQVDPDVAAAFARWLTAELGLEPSARVAVSEWISLDCREVPHTTFVSVVGRSRQLAFSIGKSLEAIEADDLPESVRRDTRQPGENQADPRHSAKGRLTCTKR